MVKTVTPSSLKWLIDKRARLSGQIYSIETSVPELVKNSRIEVEKARAKLNKQIKLYESYLSTTSKLPKLKEQLHAIDIALGLHQIQIDKNLISPIRPSSQKIKKTGVPWGGLTRGIYECLRLSSEPVTTTTVALFVMHKYAIEYDTFTFIEISHAARNRMRALSHVGKIKRLHALNNAEEGIWEIPS